MIIGVQDREGTAKDLPKPDPKRRSKAGRPKPGEQKPGAPKLRSKRMRRKRCAESGARQKPASGRRRTAAEYRGARTAARRAPAGGLHEYHTEKWEELYNKRIDETIAALKSANVPVLWVGLPSIRGQKSTADAHYLNVFYRALGSHRHPLCRCLGRLCGRAGRSHPRAGFEGQMRIRAPVRRPLHEIRRAQLAHYVERELCRVPSATPVAPMTPEPAQPAAHPAQPAMPAAPAQRPLQVRSLCSPPMQMSSMNCSAAAETRAGAASSSVATSVLVRARRCRRRRPRRRLFLAAAHAAEIQRAAAAEFSPVFMARPGQPHRRPDAQAGGPGARVAGQQVLQGQFAPQQDRAVRAARGGARPSPAYSVRRAASSDCSGSFDGAHRGSVDDPIRNVSIALRALAAFADRPHDE